MAYEKAGSQVSLTFPGSTKLSVEKRRATCTRVIPFGFVKEPLHNYEMNFTSKTAPYAHRISVEQEQDFGFSFPAPVILA